MGYSYTRGHNGRHLLDCDVCGNAGGVRKIRCPFGYCQAVAICASCKKKHPEVVSAATHREHGCEKNHNDFAAREKAEKALLHSGRVVRCSALGTDDGRVHVLFKTLTGYVGFYMSEETYNSIPLLVNATPEDYEVFGKLDPAPVDFVYKSARSMV